MMTNDDLEFVFQWVAWVLTQAKWCKKIGRENVMEWTRQSLEHHTKRIILPCGASYGIFVTNTDEHFLEDNKLQEEFKKSTQDFEKYWTRAE